MLCGDCDQSLTACWSTSKTGKTHPYYLCFNRASVSSGLPPHVLSQPTLME